MNYDHSLFSRKRVFVFDDMLFMYMFSHMIYAMEFQNNVFQNMRIPRVSTDGMVKKHHVLT